MTGIGVRSARQHRGCSFHSIRATWSTSLSTLAGLENRKITGDIHPDPARSGCTHNLAFSPYTAFVIDDLIMNPSLGPTKHRQIKPITCKEGNQQCRTFPPTQACCTRCPGSRG